MMEPLPSEAYFLEYAERKVLHGLAEGCCSAYGGVEGEGMHGRREKAVYLVAMFACPCTGWRARPVSPHTL